MVRHHLPVRAGGGGDGGVGVRGRHGLVASADGSSAAEIQVDRPKLAELSQASRGCVESGNSGVPRGGGEEWNTVRAAGDERPGRRKRKRSRAGKERGFPAVGVGDPAGSRDPPVSPMSRCPTPTWWAGPAELDGWIGPGGAAQLGSS
jgi:hypothetical protein